MKTSIIIPVLYTEPQLRATIEQLAHLSELLSVEILLVVDVPDPSREDESRAMNDELAAAGGARVLYRVGRRGFGSALRHGFSHAEGEAIIPFMGDACDDPADVPKLIRKLGEGWDIVGASRYMIGGGIVGNTLKQRLSRLYCALVRLVGGPKIHDISNAFKAYRRSVLESIETVAESYDLSVELTVKAHLAGFTIAEIPTVWTNRELGVSGFRIFRELKRYTRWLLLAARGRSTTRRRARNALPAESPTEQP